MPVFNYTAREKEATIVTGTINASDMRAAILQLTKNGLVPVDIKPDSESLKLFRFSLQRLLISKLLFLEIFSESLSRLIDSGLTIPQSIQILCKQFKQKYIVSKLRSLSEQLLSGISLSKSLSNIPSLFPSYLVVLCEAGEKSGQLSQVLHKASEFFNKLRTIKGKLLSALVYPVILLIFAIFTIAILFLYILPKISSLYKEFNADLPWLTQTLLNFGEFFEAYSVLVLFLVFIVIAAMVPIFSNREVRNKINQLIYIIPIFGSILRISELSDQLSISGMLLKNGVNLPTSFDSVVSISNYSKQKKEFKYFAQKIEQGISISKSIENSKIIPNYAKDIISLGENSNCLAESLENSAQIIKGQIEQKINIMTTLFEPFLVFMIAGGIGLMMYSILLPIFNLDFLIQ